MIRDFFLPAGLGARVEREALAAAPRECCGLLEGVRDGGSVRVTAIHPIRNRAAGADRFELDPAEQIALSRQLRERGRAIVGCYHSHPGGRHEPSPADKAGAGEEDFIWLIAAIADAKVTLRTFIYAEGDFAPVPTRLEAQGPPTL